MSMLLLCVKETFIKTVQLDSDVSAVHALHGHFVWILCHVLQMSSLWQIYVPTYLMTETLLFRVVKMDHSTFSVFSDVNYLFE